MSGWNRIFKMNNLNKKISPPPNAIPIFLASNNFYSPFVATTILSIIKNTNSFISFFILDDGILKSNKRKILSLKKQFKNFSIEFISMKDFKLKRFPNIKHYSISAFSRYFIPELTPNLNKVIYLDVDIIVTGDIAELYNQNLDGYPLGAILEDYCPWNWTYLKKICPDYKGGCNYFNSGVLLMDIDSFRKNNITQKLVDKTIELKNLLNCPDQDVLNLIFENNFKILDYKFNFFSDQNKDMLASGKKDLLDAISNHILIHYVGRKPWKDKDAEFSDKFFDIIKQTPFWKKGKLSFSKTIKEKFNFITKSKINRTKTLIKSGLGYLFLLKF